MANKQQESLSISDAVAALKNLAFGQQLVASLEAERFIASRDEAAERIAAALTNNSERILEVAAKLERHLSYE